MLQRTGRTDIPIHTFENLQENKADFCERFFSDAGVPAEFVRKGMLAIEFDSQKNSPVAWSSVVDKKSFKAESLTWAKEIASELKKSNYILGY